MYPWPYIFHPVSLYTTQLSCKHKHIKPLLQKLHWLPIVSRIQYKVASLCYNSFTESYSVYLSELLTVYHPSRQLRSVSDTRTFRIPSTKQRPLDNELFLSRAGARHSGTLYRMMFVIRAASTSSFKQALKIHLFKSAYI